MDEDVDTDEDVMYNAKNCTSRDFMATKHFYPLEKDKRIESILANVKNVSI